MRSSIDRGLLLDGKQWRGKMALTAATNLQRTLAHLRPLPVLIQFGTALFRSKPYLDPAARDLSTAVRA